MPKKPSPHSLHVFGTYPCGFTEHVVSTLVSHGVPFIYHARGVDQSTDDFLQPVATLTQKRSMPVIVLLERHEKNAYKPVSFTEDSATTVQTILQMPRIKEQLRVRLAGMCSSESPKKQYRNRKSFVFCSENKDEKKESL